MDASLFSLSRSKGYEILYTYEACRAQRIDHINDVVFMELRNDDVMSHISENRRLNFSCL